MAIISRSFPRHWNHFLSLEDDLILASRWIDFDQPNYDCYSIELARLLMSCSAEVDVIAKQICRKVAPSARAASINSYRNVIVNEYPRLPDNEVYLFRFGLTLTPWSNWNSADTPPEWWTAYNKVKHHRVESFQMATLKHTLNSASALFTLLLIHYGLSGKRRLEPRPRLFESAHYGSLDANSVLLLVQA